MIPRTVIILMCLLSASWGVAEDPSSGSAPLSFESTHHENIREGYVTLKWTVIAGAARYRVLDSDNRAVYQGFANQAFVSGLPDGTHRFDVEALSSSGEIIAKSSTPTLVSVRHWSLRQALSLFLVGLVVVSSVLIVVYRGASLPRPGGGQA